MSNTKLFFITIFNLLFILQACKLKETDCGDLSDVITNYNISDADKAKIPYTGTDTLVFISDANDTASLIGQGKNTYYDSDRRSIRGGDCPRTGIINYEGLSIIFNSSNAKLLNMNFKLIQYEDNPYVRFLVNNNEIALTNIPYLKSVFIPNDSIIINNKYITGVYMGYKTNIAVFNFNYGVIKFKDLNNITWTLNTKV